MNQEVELEVEQLRQGVKNEVEKLERESEQKVDWEAEQKVD